MALSIPESLNDFDAEWLSQALTASGVTSSVVADVATERIAIGEGFLGELARLHLTYETDESGPQTVIAKIPTTDGALKPLGVMLGVYEREALFYTHVAPKVSIRKPDVYFNGTDPESERYALLLEDVGHYRSGDHLLGASLEDAMAVIDTAAQIHSRWWDSKELIDMEWVPPLDSPINMGLQGLYEASWSTVMDQYGHLYPDWLPEKLESFIPEISQWLVSWAERSRTLTHNDFRLDNLLFDDKADDLPEVIVLDFQLVGRGDGSGDLSPFLGCNLDVDLRRNSEIDLLRRYHDAMHGRETGFETFDELVEQIDTAHLFWLVNWGNTAVMADQPNERASKLFTAILERSIAAVVDRDSVQYIGSMGK